MRISLFSLLSFCVGKVILFVPDFVVLIFVSFDVFQIVDDDDEGDGGCGGGCGGGMPVV